MRAMTCRKCRCLFYATENDKYFCPDCEEDVKGGIKEIELLNLFRAKADIIPVPLDLIPQAGGSLMVAMTHYKYQPKYCFVNTQEEAQQCVKHFIETLRRKNDEDYIREILTELNQ